MTLVLRLVACSMTAIAINDQLFVPEQLAPSGLVLDSWKLCGLGWPMSSLLLIHECLTWCPVAWPSSNCLVTQIVSGWYSDALYIDPITANQQPEWVLGLLRVIVCQVIEDVLLLGGAACEDTRQEVARCCPVSVVKISPTAVDLSGSVSTSGPSPVK